VVLSAREALDRFLLRVVDGGLAGVIFLVPLLMGGRHASGQLVLTFLAVTTAWAWAARQSLRQDSRWLPAVEATPLLLLGLVLIVVQTVPLPTWLLARLAPDTAGLLPLWNGDGQSPATLGRWSCISLTPAETMAGMVLFLDFILLFFVTVQRIRHIEDVERLLRWCAMSAVLMGSFGIVQLLAGNGKFFWFYEHPFSDASGVAKGSFTNRNHFAQFLALGIGPLIWWLQNSLSRSRGSGRERRQGEDFSVYLLGLALGVVLFAGLLSLSRGGIVAMFLATAICTAVCCRMSSLGRKFFIAMSSAGLLIGASLAIFGYDRVTNRIDDISSGSVERLDRSAARRVIWTATAKAIPHHLLLGTGVGSFGEVFPTYCDLPMDDGIQPSHAECSPLQIALECGLAGLGLTLAGVILCCSWCIRGLWSSAPVRMRLCAAAVAGSLAASAMHACVDFVWYVPACTAIVSLLAACALRIMQLGRAEAKVEDSGVRKQASLRLPAPRFSLPWAVATAALTCLGAWMIADRVGPAVAQTYWDEYLISLHEADAQLEKNPSIAPAFLKMREKWIADLENVVRWQPTHAWAHLKLTETHCLQFEQLQKDSENPMPLTHIRDAARQSRFESREALVEWLSRAVGEHWVHLDKALFHVRESLALSPLQGRGYLYLADLSFLVEAGDEIKLACIEQAIRARPYDGAVIYAAGAEALLAGDTARWLQCSKRAFRSGPRQRQQILADLVASAPPENLPALIDVILREFQPDVPAARTLYTLCRKQCSPNDLKPLIHYWVDKAEAVTPEMPPAEAATAWLEVGCLHGLLGENADSLRCARNAMEDDRNNYDVRFRLASCLLEQQFYEEAETHLKWCQARSPNDKNLEAMLRTALKGRLDSQNRTAAEHEQVR
jgi:tetratricopeptide (TPR) repeat protein